MKSADEIGNARFQYLPSSASLIPSHVGQLSKPLEKPHLDWVSEVRRFSADTKFIASPSLLVNV